MAFLVLPGECFYPGDNLAFTPDNSSILTNPPDTGCGCTRIQMAAAGRIVSAMTMSTN
jgi:hypothetical protein